MSLRSGAARCSLTSITVWLVAAAAHSAAPRLARAEAGAPPRSPAPTAAPAPLRAAEVDPAEIEDWSRGKPPPSGYVWSTRPHRALVNSGLALWVLSYAPSFALGTIGNGDLLHPGAPPLVWLFVPVAGPFVLAGEAASSTAQVLLATDGAFQAVGVGLMTLGLVWRVPILVREQQAEFRVEPAPIGLGAGLRLVGVF